MRLWLAIVLIAGALAVSGTERGRAGETKRDYLVKYLTYTSVEEQGEGLAGVKVMAYNTRTGEKYRVDEPYRDKIAVCYCDELKLERTQIRKNYSFPIDLLQNQQVRGLVRNSTPDSVEVGGWRMSCHQDKGLIGLTCVAQRAHKRFGEPRRVLQFHCIYDKNTEEVIFVDSEKYTEERYWRGYHRPFFDVNGDYLYYTMHGLAKRFDIETRTVDTIPGGSFPIIPHNRGAIIVYSENDAQYKLMSESYETTAVIDGEFLGKDILTAHALNDSTFLIGVAYQRDSIIDGQRWDGPLRMAVYELDFEVSSVRLVFEGVSTGQILSVERLN